MLHASARLLQLLMLLWATQVAHANAAPTEYDVKAAFIYKFCLYTEWPENAFSNEKKPFVIGIAGPTSLVEQMQAIVASRAIGGRAVAVRHIETNDSTVDVHILFVARSEHDMLRQIITASAGKPVLLITETKQGLDAGSAINFVVQDGRVRFEVAPDAARRHQLRFSAQLLRVAQSIREEATP